MYVGNSYCLALADHTTGAGTPLLTWTVVECGMYFSAACLVGLRPLFSRFPTWIARNLTSKDNSRHTYGASGLRSCSKRVPLKYVKPGNSRTPGSDDMDSLSHIVSANRDAESGGTKDYQGDNNYILKASMETGKIRVETDIAVECALEDSSHDRQEFFGRKP